MENEAEKTTKNHTQRAEKPLTYCVISKEKHEEQLRTTTKKKLFLAHFARSQGVIVYACEKVEIDRGTYYDWVNNDPVFAKAVQMTDIDKNKIVDDLLWYKITVEKDGPSIRFFKDRRDPAFKKRIIQEVIDGDRTLQDLLREDEEKLNDHREKRTDSPDKRGADRGPVDDPQQARPEGGVQA